MAKCHYCHDRYKKQSVDELEIKLASHSFIKFVEGFVQAIQKKEKGAFGEYYDELPDGQKIKYSVYYLGDKSTGKTSLTINKTKDDEQSDK